MHSLQFNYPNASSCFRSFHSKKVTLLNIINGSSQPCQIIRLQPSETPLIPILKGMRAIQPASRLNPVGLIYFC